MSCPLTPPYTSKHHPAHLPYNPIGLYSNQIKCQPQTFTVTLSLSLLMSPLIEFCWLFDMAGSILGLITNSILIVAIFRASRQKLQAYSYMFLFTAIFDLAYSVLEIMVQHVRLSFRLIQRLLQLIVIRDGCLFVMVHGIEWMAPSWSYRVFFPPHIFLSMHSVLILAAQFKFRYDVIRE
jgi:hypothetical protein